MRWTDIDDIVEALEDAHPEAELETLRFTRLHKWVTDLLDFEDDPGRSNERILEAIQAKWIALRND